MYGWVILKDTIWLPWYMGGMNPDGDIRNVFVNMPFVAIVPGVKTYALITMGYHVGDLFVHFAKERTNDFYEMLLHHCCAAFLFSEMILFNMLGIGCLVNYCHDVAEIPAMLVKAISQFKG